MTSSDNAKPRQLQSHTTTTTTITITTTTSNEIHKQSTGREGGGRDSANKMKSVSRDARHNNVNEDNNTNNNDNIISPSARHTATLAGSWRTLPVLSVPSLSAAVRRTVNKFVYDFHQPHPTPGIICPLATYSHQSQGRSMSLSTTSTHLISLPVLSVPSPASVTRTVSESVYDFHHPHPTPGITCPLASISHKDGQ